MWTFFYIVIPTSIYFAPVIGPFCRYLARLSVDIAYIAAVIEEIPGVGTVKETSELIVVELKGDVSI